MIAIYEIRNLINNKVYIGSSKQVNKRFTIHRHRLNKNTHANKYLQAAWNKYGKDAFEFKVIHILEKESDLIPHDKGRLCKCDECRIKNNEYRMLWKRKKRIEKKLNA